jgi:drug/metabolite transporter (DMT)-like permease
MLTLTTKKVITFIIFFIAGSWNTVFMNIMYHTKATGWNNHVMEFRRPWFQTWGMFVGMTLPIFISPILWKCKCPTYEGDKLRGWPLYRLVAIPALSDLAASVFENIALLSLSPSVWQMFRGSIIIFTAIFSIFYRKRKLYFVHWFGIFIVILGIILIGVSALLGETENEKAAVSPGMQLVAMFLVMFSQALQAVRAVTEEKILHDIDADPPEIIGFEGTWGLYVLTLIGLPLANILPERFGEGIYEDTVESFIMIGSSLELILLMVGYFLAVCFYNVSGLVLCGYTSALHRTIYDSLRSISTWATSVFVYYAWRGSGAGETLSYWSVVRLIGFGLMVIGSMIYQEMLKLPCWNRDDFLDDFNVTVYTVESMASQDMDGA